MNMFPSASMWSYKTSIKEALNQIKITAYHYIDVEPTTLDAPGALQAQKDLGLKVSCVELDHHLPSGCSWDAKDDAAMRRTVDFIKQTITKAQTLGAQTAYVGPCAQPKSLRRFGDGLRDLAGFAADKGIRFCVEHVPGRALARAGETLDFVRQIGHPNLFLLLDVGHTLITKERAWEIVTISGSHLGYVQLNDNDGRKDRHWALLEGLLTEENLTKTVQALKDIGYKGTLGLEISPDVPSLIGVFSKNHNLLMRILTQVDPPRAPA